MGNDTRTVRPAAILAVLLMASAWVVADQQPVKDDARFFSSDAVSRAESQLRTIQQKYRKTVNIETFGELPADLRGRVDGDAASVKSAFANYAQQRMYTLGADVYILVNKTPPFIESSTKPGSQSGLTSAGRDRMTAALLAAFRQKQYDAGLADLTTSLDKTFANAGQAGAGAAPAPPAGQSDPSPRSAPPPGPAPSYPPAESSGGLLGGFGCIGLLVIGVVILLVVKLIGGLFGRRNAPPAGYGQPGVGQQGYGQPGYGNQGGGFGRGIFGGLLGGLFGSWLGGNVFGQGHHDNTGGGGFGGGTSDPGGTSGGSFGDDAGNSNDVTSGGDFGGGGGDSGGGDSGTSGGSF